MINFFELFNIIEDNKQEILTEGLLDDLRPKDKGLRVERDPDTLPVRKRSVSGQRDQAIAAALKAAEDHRFSSEYIRQEAEREWEEKGEQHEKRKAERSQQFESRLKEILANKENFKLEDLDLRINKLIRAEFKRTEGGMEQRGPDSFLDKELGKERPVPHKALTREQWVKNEVEKREQAAHRYRSHQANLSPEIADRNRRTNAIQSGEYEKIRREIDIKFPSQETPRVPDPDPITQKEFEKGLQGHGKNLPDDLENDPGKLNIRGYFERTDISAWHFYLKLFKGSEDQKEIIATEFPDISTVTNTDKITRSQMQKAWMKGFYGDSRFKRGKDGSLPDPNQWYKGLGRKGANIDIGHISQGPSQQRLEEKLWNIKNVLKDNLPREEWEQIERSFDEITGKELAKWNPEERYPGKDVNLDLALKQIKEEFPKELERAYKRMPKHKRKGFDWLSHRAYKHLRKRPEFLELQKMDLKDGGRREDIFKKVIHGISYEDENFRGLKFEKEFSAEDILEKIKELRLHIKFDGTEYPDEELKGFLDDMTKETEGSPKILEPITTQGLLGLPKAIGYKRPRIQDPSAIEGDDQWVENQFRKQKVNLGKLELLVKRGEDTHKIQSQLKEIKKNIGDATVGVTDGWAGVGYFYGLYKKWFEELEKVKSNVRSNEDLTLMVNNVLKELEVGREMVVEFGNIKKKDPTTGEEVGPGFIDINYPGLIKDDIQEESVLNEMLVLAGLKESD